MSDTRLFLQQIWHWFKIYTHTQKWCTLMNPCIITSILNLQYWYTHVIIVIHWSCIMVLSHLYFDLLVIRSFLCYIALINQTWQPLIREYKITQQKFTPPFQLFWYRAVPTTLLCKHLSYKRPSVRRGENIHRRK